MDKLDRFDGVQQTIHEPVGGIFQKDGLSRSAAQRENGGNCKIRDLKKVKMFCRVLKHKLTKEIE